ncbi:MAG: hypothetical protein JWN67_5229, partial [Actinomycetia bacterium]|nr:hypothetical protein [Actinomycetes bacterium]MCU1488483.1 hypothetical protein [Actinomycetes bacterium]
RTLRGDDLGAPDLMLPEPATD